MFFWAALLLILAFMLSSCDDGVSLVTGGDELHISAKVENASKYSNVAEVKLVVNNLTVNSAVIARGDWKGDGFTIVLPKTLSANHLHTLINNSGPPTTIINAPSTLNISKKNVKVVTANFVGVDKNGNLVTYFFPFEIDKYGNAKGAFYTFVDSDVTISGHTEREGTILTEYDIELYKKMDIVMPWWSKITTTYSVNWKTGWNVWELSRFYNFQELIATEEWSSTPFGELKWYGGEGEDLWNLVLTN